MSAATGVVASDEPRQKGRTGAERAAHRGVEHGDGRHPFEGLGDEDAPGVDAEDRAEISMTHSDAGGLSTVMKFAASDDPKKNAFQLFDPAWTAAE